MTAGPYNPSETRMRAQQVSDFLAGVDHLLLTRGFKRRSRAQEWRKKVDSANEVWIHVNFGIDLVNPSIGVKYLDLSGVLPNDVGSVSSTAQMLGSLFRPPHTYSLSAGPQTAVDDLRGAGLSALSRLLDRRVVAERLKSASPSEWGTLSFSDRIRLLPLLLAALGDVDNALEVVEGFLVESAGRDQIVPGYEVFRAAFRAKFRSAR